MESFEKDKTPLKYPSQDVEREGETVLKVPGIIMESTDKYLVVETGTYLMGIIVLNQEWIEDSVVLQFSWNSCNLTGTITKKSEDELTVRMDETMLVEPFDSSDEVIVNFSLDKSKIPEHW